MMKNKNTAVQILLLILISIGVYLIFGQKNFNSADKGITPATSTDKNLVDENLKCSQLYELRKAQGNIASHDQGSTNNPNVFYIIYNLKLDTCLDLSMYGPDAAGTNYNIIDLNSSERLLDYSSFPHGFVFADPKCQYGSQTLMYFENGKQVNQSICDGEGSLLNEALLRISDFGFKNFDAFIKKS